MQHSTYATVHGYMHHKLWLGYDQRISIKNILIMHTRSAMGEPDKMGSVENDGGIAKGDPMKKGENEGLEELEEYDDYCDDLEACDDGNRRCWWKTKRNLTVTMHMLRRGRRRKRRANGIKIWRSLQMKMKCVTRRPTKGRGRHSLNCIRLMEKEDWNVLKGSFKNNGKVCNILVSRQEETTLHVEKL
jgi:hypothetical protein